MRIVWKQQPSWLHDDKLFFLSIMCHIVGNNSVKFGTFNFEDIDLTSYPWFSSTLLSAYLTSLALTNDKTWTRCTYSDRISLSVRSITIRDTLAFDRPAFRYLRILLSSEECHRNSFRHTNLESHPRIIPKRLLIGFTFFCPIYQSILTILYSVYDKQSHMVLTFTNSVPLPLQLARILFNVVAQSTLTADSKFTCFGFPFILSCLPVSNSWTKQFLL